MRVQSKSKWAFGVGLVAVCVAAWGCSSRPAPSPAASTGPGSSPASQAPVASKPGAAPAAKPLATTSASAPSETRPSGPVSKFDSKPPYPVELHVSDPAQKQPGWLRIMELADRETPSMATGVFPEQNTIRVTTKNVAQIEVHIGYLPLAAAKRIALLIDNQGIELVRGRRYVVLERRPTGQWVVVPPPRK